MFFVFLFVFSQAKKRICICYKHCHYTCPIDSFVATNSESQFKDYLITQIKGDKEIELDFYSTQDKFMFYLDLTFFSDVKITLATLNDSQPIKIKIKDKSPPINQTVEINPNFQIILPNLIPFQQTHANHGKNKLDTSHTYINGFFNKTLPESQILVSASSLVDQISGCTFYRISENFDYFISLHKPIQISENIFEYANDQITAPSPIEVHFNDHITIKKCIFINSINRVKLGNVFYCSSEYEITANFESCEFINCGRSVDEMIIKIDNIYSTVNMNNCSFKFDDSQNSGKIIDASISNVHIIGCTFFQCGEINVDIKNDKGVFEYRNNIESFNTQQFLNILNIRVKPILSNNVFQNNYLHNSYFIRILHDLDQISFDNNTFSNCSASSDYDFKIYGGAISLLIEKSDNSQCEIIFNQCKFYENQNCHISSDLAQGGALQLGFISSAANVSVEFNDCEFKKNACLNGFGGALGINIANNLTLSNCIFEDNTALKKGGAVYICSVVKSEEQDGSNLLNSIEMDSIYIVDCIFNENKASSGAAIFTEVKNVAIDLLKITYSKFTNNAGNNEDGQIMIESTNKRFSFESNIVEYTKSKSIGAIKIKVSESAVLIDSTFINCKVSDSSSVNFFASESSTPSLEMINCTFKDCETNKFAVFLQNKGITTINDCSFLFTNSIAACAGLNIDSPRVISISNCIFEKNNCKNIENAGCLFIHGETDTIDNIFLSNISFDHCSGSTYKSIYVSGRCTKIDEIRNLNIRNIENTQSDTYIFGFDTPNVDLTFENCTFSNCKSNNKNGGGIGSRLVPKNKILFSNCYFFDNFCDHNGGAFQYGGSNNQFLDKILEFQDCNFTRNKTPKFGGSLSIQTQQNLKISGCVFLQNKSGYIDESSLLFESGKGLGGALYIDPNIQEELSFVPEITIQNNIFIENSGFDAHAIYITNSKNVNIILEDTNIFTNNGQTGTAIISDQNIELLEAVFNSTEEITPISNPIKYENGPSIYNDAIFLQQIVIEEDQNISYFHNCTFYNCFQEEITSHQYAITIHCSIFSFTNCTVKFDNNDKSIGAICIDCYCNVTITDSFFFRCNVLENDQSGGIYYQPIQGNEEIEYMTFKNNTFEEMAGVNSRCFKITIDYNKIDTPISDITIKKCKDGGYTGAFYFIKKSSINTFSFAGWKFIENSAKSVLSGGCGLWISPKPNTGEDINLIFMDCEWVGNKAIWDPDINTIGAYGPRPALHNGVGGAFQFGFTESTANTQLSITNCQFRGNQAEKEGGALAIQTTRNCSIQDCIFIANTAAGIGGALFIDPDFDNPFVSGGRSPNIIIRSCQFIENSGEDGSAIYITGNQAKYQIDDITFINNQGSKNVFYSIAKIIDFRNSHFTSTSSNDIRAIEFAALASIVISNVSFIDFSNRQRNIDGGAIKISSYANTASSNLLAEEANYEIFSCTFKRCKTNNKGGAIYATNVNKVEIRSCIFDDCSGDGSIVYIERSVNEFKLHFNEIININDPTHNIFVCCSNKFNIDEQNMTNMGNVQGPLFQSDTIRLDGITFEGLRTGITIGENVKDASITNCRFIDCVSDNKFVIVIENSKTLFEYNTISFTKNFTENGGALHITGYGSIKANHNQFLYPIPSSPITFSMSSIVISPKERSETEPIEFNYNLIQGISSAKKFCIFIFNLANQAVIFNHNKIYKCINSASGDNSYMSQITNLKSDFTFEDLTFEECSTKTKYGGSFGCWFTSYDRQPSYKISFIDCRFINNEHKSTDTYSFGGGAFQFGQTATAYFEIYMEGCLFEGNSALRGGGALSLGRLQNNAKNQPMTIRDCIFNNNTAKEDFAGAIRIFNDDVETITIEGCKFDGNYGLADDNGEDKGSAIYISYSKTASSSNIVEIHSNCVFHNNYNPNDNNRKRSYAIYTESPVFSINCSSISADNIAYRTSGIIFAGSNSQNSVYNVSFYKCKSTDLKAHAIHIQNEPASVEISSCTFTWCGFGDGEVSNDMPYIIHDEGKNTIIDVCSFIGGAEDLNPRAPTIFVNSYGVHSITNCYIENSVTTNKGAIRYLDTSNEIVGSQENQNVVLRNITFNTSRGKGRVALNLILNTNNVEVSDISIINSITENTLIGLEFRSGCNKFDFVEFNFTDNTCHGTYGGGSGIFIERDDASKDQPLTISVNNCKFIRNHAEGTSNHQGIGGGLQFGDTATSAAITFSVTDSIFEDNSATRYGGALAIYSENDVSVHDCQFRRNTAELGGAIYVDTSKADKKTTITDCSFEDNEGTGCAVYCTESKSSGSSFGPSLLPSVEITGNCQFRISTKKALSLIHSKCNNLNVHDLTFDMESLDKTCRAIYIEKPAKTPIIKNVIFRNCDIGGEGNAIYVDMLHEYSNQRTRIESCRYENCGTIGFAVYSLDKALQFRDNTITYTSNAKGSGGGGLYAAGLYSIERNVFENTFKYRNEIGNSLTLSHTFTWTLGKFIYRNNVFSNCNGEDGPRCFDITFLNFDDSCNIIENITVRDCPEAPAILGSITVNNYYTDYFIFEDCNWINNQVTASTGGGIGLSIQAPTSLDIYFEGCLFENNTNTVGRGGAIQISYLSNQAYKCIFNSKTTFRNNKSPQGGAISFETTSSWIVANCIFENNNATNGRGGAIYVNTELGNDVFSGSSIIRSSIFINNTASNPGTMIGISESSKYSGTITIEGSNTMKNVGEYGFLISNGYKGLILNGIQFSYEGNGNRQFSVLYSFSNGTTNINDCTFNGVGYTKTSSNDIANVIRMYENDCTVEVLSCKFIDCVGDSNDKRNFIILGLGSNTHCKTLEVTNSEFTFSNTDRSAAAICLERYAKMYINSCNFTNCWVDRNGKYSGAIRYGPSIDTLTSRDFCRFEITNCVFDNCNNINSNGGRVICGRPAKSSNVFSDCIIKNTVNGSYIFQWEFVTQEQEFTLTNFIFENNQACCPEGGAGISILKTTKITFSDCSFIANSQTHDTSNGGAFSCPSDSTASNQEIIFDKCHFENNSVTYNGNGGALYLRALSHLVTVKSCTFVDTRPIYNNGVARLGGAIYVDSDNAAGIKIESCTFSHTQARSDGNAICIAAGGDGLVEITGSKFRDCHHNGRYSVIWSYGLNSLLFDGNEITFSDLSQSSRGLIVSKPSNVTIKNSLFYKCIYTENGCGFAYNPQRQQSALSEDVVIENTIFDSCYSSTSGRLTQSALYLYINQPVTLTRVTIQNSKPSINMNILILDSRSPMEEQIISDCFFINCTTQYIQDNKGGIGFKYDNIKHLVFDGCQFNGLLSTGYGGAVAFNDLRSNSEGYSVEFDACKFSDNSLTDANGKGGSLYINVSYEVVIKNCNFTDHTLNGYGGSIYGEYASNILIQNTEFYLNKEASGNGNAIYLSDNLPICSIIGNNKFIDCGDSNSGSVIESKATEFVFDGNQILFNNEEKGARGIYFSCRSKIKVVDSLFIRCNVLGNGGGLFYESGSEIQTNETYNEIEITNCSFIRNKSNRHGGSCFFGSVDKINISNCLFDGNIANKQYSSSSTQLLSEKQEGLGGALFISSSYDDTSDSNDIIYLIENCTFINNKGNDGNSIYIEGIGTGNEFIIRQNNFTNNFRAENENNDPYFIYRAVITSEVFNLYEGKVLTENMISNFDAVQKVKLSYVNQNGIPVLPTKTSGFSMSDHFTKSKIFSESSIFTESNIPTEYFTESKIFSESNSFSSLKTPFVHTKMPIYSNSFSLTYVLQKSISFSISYYSSNTYSISFNIEENTYVFVSSEMNLYSYFPYLIRYLSPSYVPTYISINKIRKKGISQEQLIGLTCGSASVFFLILGIIILIVRRRREIEQIYDEFDDISYSNEEVTIQKANNQKDNMDDNSYDSGNQDFFL